MFGGAVDLELGYELGPAYAGTRKGAFPLVDRMGGLVRHRTRDTETVDVVGVTEARFEVGDEVDGDGDTTVVVVSIATAGA